MTEQQAALISENFKITASNQMEIADKIDRYGLTIIALMLIILYKVF